MTAVIFPKLAAVQYAKALLQITGEATRDISTLTRQAAALMGDEGHGRVMGVLRRYAKERNQLGTDEVLEIVADMETFVDPKIVEHKKRIEAGREARAEERCEKEEAEERAAWEPDGVHWTAARDQMMADAHALIYAAKLIGDGDGEHLVGAMRGYCESEARDRLFTQLADGLKPPLEVTPSPRKRRSRTRQRAPIGNVIDGPWAS